MRAIVVLDKGVDLFDQILDAAEGAAANGPLSDQAEPALHLIQPRRVCRGVVNVIEGSLGQPGAHLTMFVRGVVVHHQVHVELFRNTGVQLAQKREKLLMPVARLALGEDRTGGNVERRESPVSAAESSKILDQHQVAPHRFPLGV